jgi:hypothetical protein
MFLQFGSFGVGLTTLHCKKNKFVTTMYIEPRTWTDCLDKTTEYGYEIQIMECKDSVLSGLHNDNF